MCERRQITTGAHRTLLRDYRRDAVIQHRDQCVNQQRPAATVTKREHVSAQEQHCAGFRNWQWRTQTAGMAANQVQLQSAQFIRFDPHVRKASEAGVDAIDGAAFSDNLLDDPPRLLAALPGRRRQSHLFMSASHSGNLSKG